MEPIGKIQRFDLRSVWAHEEYDFSKWLAENVDVLNERTGLELSDPEREKPAGDFSVDLIAKDGDGGLVVIENQLGKSDHDHLGKLVTYAAAYGASAALWIVADPRAEHAAAINWLNMTNAAKFYLLKAEAIRIGNSPPALNLILVMGPSDVAKEVGPKKKEIAERHTLRRAFWTELLSRAALKTPRFKSISPGDDNWLSASSGVRNFYFLYRVKERSTEVLVEIYSDNRARNVAALRALEEHRSLIESEFGSPLEWVERPGRGAWVLFTSDSGGYRSAHEEWGQLQDAMIDSMVRLERAVGPHLRRAGEEADNALAASNPGLP